MKIKDISEENRPRERLIKYGAGTLSDAELLAIILQKGTKGENVIDMSNRLISKHTLNKISDLSIKELQEIKGIGPAKAAQIKAIFELNKRNNMIIRERTPIKSAKDVFEYASQRLPDRNKEQFMILHLDSKNKIIKDEIISIGILNASIVHPREVFKSAIKENANAIILTHNHPSGDPTPSEEDEKITEIIQKAGEIIGISVLDHVIIGNTHYSFREERKI